MGGEHQVDAERKKIPSQRSPTEAPAREAVGATHSYSPFNPHLLSPGAIMALQRTVGNTVVNQLLRRHAARTAESVEDAARSQTAIEHAQAQPARTEAAQQPAHEAWHVVQRRGPERVSPGAVAAQLYPLTASPSLGPWQPDRAAGAPPMVVQRMWDKGWDDLTAGQKTVRTNVNGANEKTVYAGAAKATLSAPLQAGLTLAQANPDAVPADPAWLSVDVKKIANGQYFKTKQNKYVTQPMYNTAYKKQFRNMWAHGHNNNEGNKPGVAGAGGYKEYYAEPSPDAAGWWDAKMGVEPLGKNRILQQTNADQPYWWASDDHYNTVTFITDA